MSNPNFCPECGHDLQQYENTDKNTEKQSTEDLTREDYKRIFREELEKAKEQDQDDKDDKPYSGKSGEEMTREDYEEILENKLEEVREDKNKEESEVDVSDVDPEIKESIKTLVEMDREIIEHMRDGLQKDIALDIQDMSDGKTENLRILGD